MAEFDPESVQTETELTDEEIARVLNRKPKWVVPTLISLGSIGVLTLLVYFGGSFLPSGNVPTPMLTPPEPKLPTPEFVESLTDTLDLGDLGADIETDSTDSLHLYLKHLLATPVDTSQMAELPPMLYDTVSGILSARVEPTDLVGDTTLPYLEMLISPLRNDIMEVPKMPWEVQEKGVPSFAESSRDTLTAVAAPALSEKDKKALEVKQSQIDSLALQLGAAERALAKTSEERTNLAERIDRLKPALDSVRTAELKRFSKILETMKPAAAAQMLAQRTPSEVSEILFRVKPRTAAAIMQYLPPQLASDIAARVVRR